jgi:hypothetical protein
MHVWDIVWMLDFVFPYNNSNYKVMLCDLDACFINCSACKCNIFNFIPADPHITFDYVYSCIFLRLSN